MSLGPYKIENAKVTYKGNKIYPSLDEVRHIKPPNLSRRHLEIKRDFKKWEALIKIWDGVFRASNDFMKKRKVLLFDLPIITRMISSPGALTNTIPSDVDPFEIDFFNQKTFLTQSSQLYLEFAITNPKVNSVYCWEKSFRKEKADFRHLPEFTHIEFEANIKFEENLEFQQKFVQHLINYLILNQRKEIELFLKKKDIKELESFTKLKKVARIKFQDVFKLLKQRTGDQKYNRASIKKFGSYEEILLTQIVKKPIFVTHYIGDEVAFYHAIDYKNPSLVINADFLFPGYGELIGSGERVHTKEETYEKAKHFNLDLKDYKAYIESRDYKKARIHSGWGMGIERFIQSILKLPFIWETKPFPRINSNNYL